MEAIKRHVCPICVFQGAVDEDPRTWLNFKNDADGLSMDAFGVRKGDA